MNFTRMKSIKLLDYYLLTALRSGKHVRMSSTSPEPKSYQDIPGLTSLPIIGPLHHFLPVIGTIGPQLNFYKLSDALYKKFGSIVKMDGIFNRSNMVILYEPEHYNKVFRSEESAVLRPGFDTLVYYREELRKNTFDGVYGLTSAQGAKWRDFRFKVNPALLNVRSIELYSSGLEEIADDMVNRLSRLKNVENYLERNFDTEMTRWSLESVALVCLGARLGTLSDDLTDEHPAKQLMQCAHDIFELSFKLEFLPSLWRYISTSNFKRLMKTYDLQWEISSMYIEQARIKIKEREHDIPDEDKSIIEKLLAIDERVAIMMANEMMLAGIDTVAFAASCLLYHLAAYPEVQNKLREEIKNGSGNRYLRACLKESMRIYPVISSNLRRTSKEHIVGDYKIPKGIDVISPNEFLSKMEKHYPQPFKFIPERWLVEKSHPLYYGNTHPLTTSPFGFGIRSCIGRRIAELEIQIFIKKLIQNFNISWQGPPIKVKTKVMNVFVKPYHFKFEPIN